MVTLCPTGARQGEGAAMFGRARSGHVGGCQAIEQYRGRSSLAGIDSRVDWTRTVNNLALTALMAACLAKNAIVDQAAAQSAVTEFAE